MKDYNLIIGSHVSMNKQQNYLLGALNESLNNNANAMMIYTGPPQNTIRVSTEQFFIPEFYQQLKEHHFDINNIIIHALYIINLANTTNPNTFEIVVEFLKKKLLVLMKLELKQLFYILEAQLVHQNKLD